MKEDDTQKELEEWFEGVTHKWPTETTKVSQADLEQAKSLVREFLKLGKN